MAGWDLERDEVELLTEICRQLDTVDALALTLAEQGVTAVGSRGQVRVHPLVAAVSGARALLARLVAQLGLPDQDAATLASPAQTQARRAAASRWRNHVPRGRRGAA